MSKTLANVEFAPFEVNHFVHGYSLMLSNCSTIKRGMQHSSLKRRITGNKGLFVCPTQWCNFQLNVAIAPPPKSFTSSMQEQQQTKWSLHAFMMLQTKFAGFTCSTLFRCCRVWTIPPGSNEHLSVTTLLCDTDSCFGMDYKIRFPPELWSLCQQ